MAFTKVLPTGISSSFNLTVDSINSVGVVTATEIVATTGTFSGNVSIAGTLTYEDVSNIDSVGIITARDGINVTGGHIGVGVTPETWTHNLRAVQIGRQACVTGQTGANIIEISANAYHNSGWKYIENDTATSYYQYQGNHVFSSAASGTADDPITFSERLRITSSGRLSIGNYSSPKSPLHIRGEYLDQAPVAGVGTGSFVISNSDTDYGINFGVRSSGTGWIQQTRVDGTGTNYSLLLNPLGGNIGIGTDDPQHNLHLYNNGDATLFIEADADNVDEDHNPKISMSQDGQTSSIFDIGINGSAGNSFTDALANTTYLYSVSNTTSNGLQFATNGAARMYIDNSGKIGIGTNDPDLAIHLESGTPYIRSKNTAAPSNEKTWDFNAGTDGILRFRNTNDAANSSNNWLEVERDGVSTSAIRLLTGSGTQRLRVDSSVSGYPYVGISTSGLFRDQRLPLSIHGRGFGHGWTQQGTTQDAVYLTAGASGNYSTLTLTVNKSSWGSVAYEIHAAAYNGRHLHRIGGFYQNGDSIAGDHGSTTASSSSTFAISAPASQQFTMTISGGTWVHPSAWVRLVLSGNGSLRSDLITFSWS